MKFTPQRMKFLHSMNGLNYSLEKKEEVNLKNTSALREGATALWSKIWGELLTFFDNVLTCKWFSIHLTDVQYSRTWHIPAGHYATMYVPHIITRWIWTRIRAIFYYQQAKKARKCNTQLRDTCRLLSFINTRELQDMTSRALIGTPDRRERTVM